MTDIHTIILNIILHACFGVTVHSRTLKKKNTKWIRQKNPLRKKNHPATTHIRLSAYLPSAFFDFSYLINCHSK